mgnify:CR=1 FL=1
MQSRAGQTVKELSSGAKLEWDHQVVALKKERTNKVSYLFIQSWELNNDQKMKDTAQPTKQHMIQSHGIILTII